MSSSDQYARDNGFSKLTGGMWECKYCGGVIYNLSKHRSRCKWIVLQTPVYDTPKKRWWQ